MKYITDVQFWIGWIVAALVMGFLINLMRKA
jgi:hypothetical protein